MKGRRQAAANGLNKESTMSEVVSGGSVPFAAFSPTLFVASQLSSRVADILNLNRGGNYGVAGVRGAGKSWLMQEAIAVALDQGGFGLWFPSPTAGDPEDFLVSISDVLAKHYMDYFINTSPDATAGQRRSRLLLLYGSAAGLYLGLALIAFAVFSLSLPQWLRGPNAIFAVVGLALVILASSLTVYTSILRRTATPKTNLYEKAREISRQARYVAAIAESQQTTGGLVAYAASLGIRRERSSSFTERPATLSTLVHDFREFATAIAGTFHRPVVIAIDELDKMESPDEVTKLLRGIKGIFDVPGVHYFVSVSDEAAARLDLAGIRGRDEFNSSFYQVFRMPLASPQFISKVLNRRGVRMNEECLDSIALLSDGVPREAVRLAETLMGRLGSRIAQADVFDGVQAILLTEVESFELQSERAFAGSNGATHDGGFVNRTFVKVLKSRSSFVDAKFFLWWELQGASEQWKHDYGEECRRMLVRMVLGQRLVQAPDGERSAVVQDLQQAASRAESSASAARALLETA